MRVVPILCLIAAASGCASWLREREQKPACGCAACPDFRPEANPEGQQEITKLSQYQQTFDSSADGQTRLEDCNAVWASEIAGAYCPNRIAQFCNASCAAADRRTSCLEGTWRDAVALSCQSQSHAAFVAAIPYCAGLVLCGNRLHAGQCPD